MKLSRLFSPPPVRTRHYKRTFVFSPDDDPGRPTDALVSFALDVVRSTMTVDLSQVSARMTGTPRWPDTWPGEHYRLLAGIVAHLKPACVVEIGTHTGLSALSMLNRLAPTGRLTTFDLIKWDAVPGTCLRQEDFSDGRLVQILADLGDPGAFQRHADVIRNADLLFVDGPKDRKFEPAFARNLDAVQFRKPPFVIFDDIKELNMLKFWRELAKPKLDLTSFGHWTGTGLTLWTNGVQD